MPKFSRETGDRYVIPQRFADETFPRCPICGTGEPLWQTAYKYKGLMKYYWLKCDKCQSILAVSEADMTGLSFTTVTVQGRMKQGSGKDNRTVYVKIQEIGLAITEPEVMRLEKKELSVEQLKAYAERNIWKV